MSKKDNIIDFDYAKKKVSGGLDEPDEEEISEDETFDIMEDETPDIIDDDSNYSHHASSGKEIAKLKSLLFQKEKTIKHLTRIISALEGKPVWRQETHISHDALKHFKLEQKIKPYHEFILICIADCIEFSKYKSKKNKWIIVSGYVWIKNSKIRERCPHINRSARTLRRYIEKLIDLRLIDRLIKQPDELPMKGRTLCCYRLTERGEQLINWDR